ncbi:MAG: methyltransferase domain-containing protein [Chitinivibrionales bacterium]|nr:methyltransferase domain-containing protein [Chitinivibrionales bacterium]MBD3397023.1 methyltransferase domain-containing protein [Chitinivibrionales bacterium]
MDWSVLQIPMYEFADDGSILPNFAFHRTWDHVHSRCIEYPWVASRYHGEDAILDVGSAKSNPQWLWWLNSLRKQVVLVDLDTLPNDCDHIHCEKANILNLPFHDDAFDVVFAVSVIEHVGLRNAQVSDASRNIVSPDGDVLAFNELIRVLRPGGRLLMTVPFGTVDGLILEGSTRCYTARSLRRFASAGTGACEYYQFAKKRSPYHSGIYTWIRMPPDKAQARHRKHTDGVLCGEWTKK